MSKEKSYGERLEILAQENIDLTLKGEPEKATFEYYQKIDILKKEMEKSEDIKEDVWQDIMKKFKMTPEIQLTLKENQKIWDKRRAELDIEKKESDSKRFISLYNK